MKKLTLIFAFVVMAGMAHAQTDDQAIEQVIASLFDGMREKDLGKLETAFHNEAIMHTVISNGENNAALGVNSPEEFIKRIDGTPADVVLDERILEYQIKVDGEMASAWTPYEFYVNNNLSHCGVNSFQLIKTEGEWKITYVIDTRRKEGCE